MLAVAPPSTAFGAGAALGARAALGAEAALRVGACTDWSGAVGGAGAGAMSTGTSMEAGAGSGTCAQPTTSSVAAPNEAWIEQGHRTDGCLRRINANVIRTLCADRGGVATRRPKGKVGKRGGQACRTLIFGKRSRLSCGGGLELARASPCLSPMLGPLTILLPAFPKPGPKTIARRRGWRQIANKPICKQGEAFCISSHRKRGRAR